MFVQSLQAGLAGVGRDDTTADLFQASGDDPSNIFFIFDDQDRFVTLGLIWSSKFSPPPSFCRGLARNL
jgi:hypothetical protein